MKNQIVFPENCRLFEQQRKTLERALETFPIDLFVTDFKFSDQIVYPNLIFSKKRCSAMRQISGSSLIPDTESESYTLNFNGDVRLEANQYDNGKRLWRYGLFTGEKSIGSFMYSELWDSEYPNIYPPSPLTFRVQLAIPLRKLIGVDGKLLFGSNYRK